MTTGLIGAPLLPGHSKRSMQVRVHAETLYTMDFLSRKTLFLALFFPPRLFKQPQHFLWKKKERLLPQGAVFLLIILVSLRCLEDSRGQSDIWLWYGLQNFCCVQGRGDGLFSLTWQPNESLECCTEFTLKVTLLCRLPYLGERTVRKDILLITL